MAGLGMINIQARIAWWGQVYLAVCDFIPLLFIVFRSRRMKWWFIYHGFWVRVDRGRWGRLNRTLLKEV